jgi:hypothetical protein
MQKIETTLLSSSKKFTHDELLALSLHAHLLAKTFSAGYQMKTLFNGYQTSDFEGGTLVFGRPNRFFVTWAPPESVTSLIHVFRRTPEGDVIIGFDRARQWSYHTNVDNIPEEYRKLTETLVTLFIMGEQNGLQHD